MPVDETWDGKPHWQKEPEVPEKYIQSLDKAVEAAFPHSVEFIDILPHGASFWTRTAQVVTRSKDNDDEIISYFLKVSIGENGKGMMHGEFVSMNLIHEAMPHLCPKVYAWGTFESDPNIHFLLCDFVEMDQPPCALETFPKLVAELHKTAIAPDGKFGFPLTTYYGRLKRDNTPCDTWEEYFTRNLNVMFDHEEVAQGFDEEFARLRDIVVKTVVPRLLRPLETQGRKLLPRLIHGDLWDGNTGTDLETGAPLLFDAASIYAHNEYELAPWRPVRHIMGKAYVNAYLQHFPPSEPVEDFDGRLLLYTVKFNVGSSALYPGNLNYRALAQGEMQELVDRYGEGYEAWAKTHE